MLKRKNLSEPTDSSSRRQWPRRTSFACLRGKQIHNPKADASCHYRVSGHSRLFGGVLKGGLTVIISVLVIYGIVQAGSLTPSASPAATSYTLSDIYTRLTTNVTSTLANHVFSPAAVPAGTLYSLTQVYDAIPTIVASTVKLGTSYLGVSGSLTPDGGTAATGDLFNGKTAHLTNDWTLDTGALNLACNTATFDGTGNLVGGTYDGDGNGTNRWCITDAEDITDADVLSGKIVWINGATTTGAMANNGVFGLTASSTDQSVTAGYYSGGTLAGDADLVSGNIANNVNIFGVIGNMIAGYLYGDSDQSKVLTTATGAGTYNASNLSNSTVKNGTAYGVSSTGAYSGYPGSGWTGGTTITQAACDAQNGSGWYWFEDGNGDGDTTDPEDGVCVQATAVITSLLSWNGSEQIGPTPITAQAATAGTANSITKASAGWTANAYADAVVKITSGTALGCWGVVKSNTTDTITVYGSWLSSAYASNCGTPDATSVFAVEDDGWALYDNSWIGDWSCTGSFPNGTVSWASYPTTAKAGSGNIALAKTDCYDGVRDLLPTEISRAVKTGEVSATSTNSITTNLDLNVNAWVGQKVLITGGTGTNTYGRIESNTAGPNSVIVVDSWTGTEPSTDSTFAIIYLIPHAAYNPGTQIDGDNDDQLNGNNGPLTQEVLNNWKGSRLPTASDFFGFCGYKDGGSNYENTTGTYSSDKTYGDYGGQVGRTVEFLDLANSGAWEWLSEQHFSFSARVAGLYACSFFGLSHVSSGNRFRAVFRP